MAFNESDRVQIRHYLGFGALYQQSDPRLEYAISAVQAISDGGTRPDNSTELYIKGVITNLQTIETNLQSLWTLSYVQKAETLALDPYRGMMMLRAEGRRLVSAIARMLSTRPRADIFSSTPPGSTLPDSLTPGFTP